MKSRVLIMLGLVAQNKGLHEAALEYFDRAKDICHAGEDHYGEAAAALDAGILLYRGGRFSSAETRIERAREIFASIGWSVGVSRSLLALGSVATYRGEFARAVRFFRDASRIADQGGFARERALAREFSATCISSAEGSRPPRSAIMNVCASRSISRPKGTSSSRSKEGSASSIFAKDDAAAALPHLRRALRLLAAAPRQARKGSHSEMHGKRGLFAWRAGAGRALFRKATGTLQRAGCDFELGKTHCVRLAEILPESERSR